MYIYIYIVMLLGVFAGRWFNAIDERGLPAHCIADHWSDWNSSYSTHTKVRVGVNISRDRKDPESDGSLVDGFPVLSESSCAWRETIA